MEDIFSKLSREWFEKLQPQLGDEYFEEINKFIASEQTSHTLYPVTDDIFTAFNLTPPSKVKVVIIGQDPYHGAGEAHGLAFSVKQGVKTPPSLRNIFKAINIDLGVEISPEKGDLSAWAGQGVLLINSSLTVRADSAASHRGKGWERFTNEVIALLNREYSNIVYILWGKDAWKKEEMLSSTNNLILKSVHPSPLSAYRGFFEANHFSQTNRYLSEHGKGEIDFTL